MNLNLNGLLDPDFVVNSYEDFLGHAQKKASDFLNFLYIYIDCAKPDIDTDIINFPDVSEVTSELQKIGLQLDSIIAVKDGFLTIGDFIPQFETAYADYYAGEIATLSDAAITATDNLGNSVTTTIQDVVDSVKDNLCGSLAEASALKAAEYSNIADRVSYFKTYLENNLGNAIEQGNFDLSYYKNKLLNNYSPIELLQQFMSDLGVEQLDDDSGSFVLNDFNISKYTGANPLGVLGFSCVKDIAVSIGRSIGRTIKAINEAVIRGSVWLWNKVKKYTVEVFYDPYDVTDSGNSKTKSCFETFQYQGNFNSYDWNPDADICLDYTPFNFQDFEAEGANLLGHWYLMKTVGGEIAVNPSGLNLSWNSNTHSVEVQWAGKALFKPYSLNINIPKGQTCDEFMDNVNATTEGLYLDTQSSESDLYRSFAYGTNITEAILQSYINDFAGLTPTWNVVTPTAPSPVTNLDWLRVACGYRVVDGVTRFDYCPSTSTNLRNLAALLISIVLIAEVNSAHDREMVDLYYPFVKDTQGMSTGRFGLKTDTQNAAIAVALAATIIIIAAVVIGAVAGTVILRKHAKKLFFKRTEFVGQMDSKMWEGGVLTAKEKKKYLRYMRKLNASDILTSGISTAASVTDTLSDKASSICTTLSNVIQGYDGDNSPTTTSSIIKLINPHAISPIG